MNGQPSLSPKRTSGQWTPVNQWSQIVPLFVSYWIIRLYVLWDFTLVSRFEKDGFRWGVEVGFSLLLFYLWFRLIDWFQDPLGRVLFGVRKQVVLVSVVGVLTMLFSNAVFHLEPFKGTPKSVGPIQQAGLLFLPLSTGSSKQEKFDTGLLFLTLLTAFLLATFRKRYQYLEDLHRKEDHLKREIQLKRFSVLQNQGSSSFLFTYLDLLSSSIRSSTDRSIQLIKHLSKSYRYVLEKRHDTTVTLQEELDSLQNHLMLWRLHWGDQLCVMSHIYMDEARHYLLVPMTLQVLVNNAIRYNQMSYEIPLLITIEIEQDYLIISNLVWPRKLVEPTSEPSLPDLINHYRLLTEKPILVVNQANVFLVKIPLFTESNEPRS